jgi:hypothetical protein
LIPPAPDHPIQHFQVEMRRLPAGIGGSAAGWTQRMPGAYIM